MDAWRTAISSLVDTWLVLRDLESNGERNRGLHILKSRGMAHSNQVREFVLSDSGIQLADVYLGPNGMLTGSARVAQEARERAAHQSLGQEVEWQKLALERKRAAVEGQIAALRAEFSAEEATIEHILRKDQQHEASLIVEPSGDGPQPAADSMENKSPGFAGTALEQANGHFPQNQSGRHRPCGMGSTALRGRANAEIRSPPCAISSSSAMSTLLAATASR